MEVKTSDLSHLHYFIYVKKSQEWNKRICFFLASHSKKKCKASAAQVIEVTEISYLFKHFYRKQFIPL
jgi:hypothetical protein